MALMKFKSAPPVDKGWAWVVVFSAFMHLFILIGLAKSSGMIFAELIEKYNGKASTASVMVALQTGISLFAAPIITAAVEITSCRSVSYFGCVVFSLAYILASFMDSMEEISILYGVLAGVGYGCCLTPTPVIVGRYFDKKRSLANGLAFSGTGLGNVLLPMLVYHLLDKYFLHGTLLILGAFSLQVAVFASLYRPLALYTRPEAQPTPSFQEVVESDGNRKLIRPSVDSNGTNKWNYMHVNESKENGHAAVERMNSTETDDITSRVYEECIISPRIGFTTQLSNEGNRSRYESALDLSLASSVVDIPRALSAALTAVAEDEEPSLLAGTEKEAQTAVALMRQFQHRLKNFKFAHLVSYELLHDYEFLAFVLGVVVFLNAFFLSMVVPSHCYDLGFSKADAALILSIQGGADMCGRLSIALIGDMSFFKARRRWAMLSYTTLLTLLALTIPLCRTFASLSCALVASGLVFGAFVALNPVVVTDIVGLQNLAKAWGIQLFLEGFTLTSAPVILGSLKDYTQSYDSGFLYVAFSSFIASVCILVSNLIGTKRSRKESFGQNKT